VTEIVYKKNKIEDASVLAECSCPYAQKSIYRAFVLCSAFKWFVYAFMESALRKSTGFVWHAVCRCVQITSCYSQKDTCENDRQPSHIHKRNEVGRRQ